MKETVLTDFRCSINKPKKCKVWAKPTLHFLIAISAPDYSAGTAVFVVALVVVSVSGAANS